MTTRDSLIKRHSYTFVALFYDMTPNIRWGFEWGLHGTNRKDSAQDAQSNRWQFGAYYFFSFRQPPRPGRTSRPDARWAARPTGVFFRRNGSALDGSAPAQTVAAGEATPSAAG